MGRRAAGLTARQVAAQKAAGLFADGGGLYLQVTATGAKSWIFRFQLAGRRRDMGLGSAAVYSLAEARQKATEARRLVAAGVDPIAERAAAAAAEALATARAMTFRDCARAYIEAMRPGWKNAKHAAQWESTLDRYVYPTLGDLPVDGIDTGLVCKVLEPIWTKKTETASRVRGRLEAILDWAKVRGHRSGENPARWKGHLSLILPARGTVAKVEHHAALPYAAVPGFWPKLQVQDGMGARALEFAILTATRTGEVVGARWDEIDEAAKLWIIPAGRMKAGAELRVPLSAPTLGLLKKLRAVRTGPFVFPGQTGEGGLSNMAMAMVLRRMEIDVTPHGFRSTFRTWVAECTTFPHEVAEAALGHVQGDRVVAAYQRGDLLDRRRQLMTAWAGFVEGTTADVAPLRREA